MIRLRPTQIDLAHRDFRDTVDRIQLRREALVANLVNREDGDARRGTISAGAKACVSRSNYGPDLEFVPGQSTQEPRARGLIVSPRRLCSDTSFLSAVDSPDETARTTYGCQDPSADGLCQGGLRVRLGRQGPVEDGHGILAARGLFRSGHLPASEVGSPGGLIPEPVSSLLEDSPAESGHEMRAALDHRGQEELLQTCPRRSPALGIPWEESLREIERRLSGQPTLRDPSNDDQKDDRNDDHRFLASDTITTADPSDLESFEVPSSLGRALEPASLQKPARRGKRPAPSRLYISQAMMSSSSEPELPGHDRVRSSHPSRRKTKRPGSPGQWKRYRLEAVRAWPDSDSEDEEVRQWSRRVRDPAALDDAAEGSSSSRASSVVRHPPFAISPRSLSPQPVSPLSGVRVPVPPVDGHLPSPPTRHDLPNRPRVPGRTSQPPHNSQTDSQVTPTTDVVVGRSRASTPPLSTTPPAPPPRTSRRSMRVYNDRLPASEQPQTPSSRHSRPFDPAFTAPAGLRRVFRLSRTRPHDRDGSLGRGEDAATAEGLEQENVSILVEAARWEQRIRASLDRRSWRSWTGRRRHSGDAAVADIVVDDPHLDESHEEQNDGEATRRLDRTPERAMPHTARG